MQLNCDYVSLTVPATSANLGSAFDSIGLALELRDRVSVRAVAGPSQVTVRGEGADTVGLGDNHLVVRAIHMGLEYMGAPQVGVALTCTNSIPHARGLGSSAAAAVVGLVAARALVAEPGALSDEEVLQLATELEGHPDNAAPALLGGATLAWMDAGRAHAIALQLAPTIAPVLLIPPTTASTRGARAALPPTVAHSAAVFNVSRSALLVEALRTGEHLMAATDDLLHQPYRAEVMGESTEVVRVLRAAGTPAALSGAGPAVIAFGSPSPALSQALLRHQWRVVPLSSAREGVKIVAGGRKNP